MTILVTGPTISCSAHGRSLFRYVVLPVTTGINSDDGSQSTQKT